MTVLDAYAVIAYLKGEVAADEVRPLLDDATATLTALGVAEVIDHLVRMAASDEEDALLDLAQLGLLDGRTVDSGLGIAAGRLRARHYDRRRCQVSLAGCVAAEAARSGGEPLATADPDLLDVCHAEGTAVVVLPGSAGRAGRRHSRDFRGPKGSLRLRGCAVVWRWTRWLRLAGDPGQRFGRAHEREDRFGSLPVRYRP